jgi:ssDNA-binding Zn-finger/Zn-ribbon topoisomerase 1
LEHGGFTENLHAARLQARGGSQSDADAPVCPECGKPMRRRTAHKGPHAGQPFWGCTGYPECKGILPIQSPPAKSPEPTEPDKPAESDQSDKSDPSDRSDSSDRSDQSGG